MTSLTSSVLSTSSSSSLPSAYDRVAATTTCKATSKRGLLALSRALESQALSGGARTVLVTFQDRRHVTAATRASYARLAREGARVSIFARGLVSDYSPDSDGLQHVALRAEDPLVLGGTSSSSARRRSRSSRRTSTPRPPSPAPTWTARSAGPVRPTRPSSRRLRRRCCHGCPTPEPARGGSIRPRRGVAAGVTALSPAVPLSVLDLAPVSSGRTTPQALQESIALARRVEELGYRRVWVAEHHGMPGIASSAPAVLIGALAAATTRIRVGSGGVMLPNHAPLVVAEQFGTLEALHPGRIDLGLGRAPGTDQRTASLLRRGDADDFPGELALLRAFFDGPVHGITAVPAEGNAPDVWLLGSSGFSAQLAGLLGLPFAFAHHFSGHNTIPALELYRNSFRPGQLAAPYAMVCASVLLADSGDEARRLALPGALSFVRLRQGVPGPLSTVAEAEAHPWTAQERAFAEQRLDSQVLGTPEQARGQLDRLVADTGADELMVTTTAHAFADRLRSYDLLAGLGVAAQDGLALPRAA